MHRCLQVQELLSIIFQYVYVLRPKRLARLARTCKTFQEPALNILWHTQYTFLPLLKCLPCDAWVMKKGTFSITRNLSAYDFERIHFYCHRIRSFGQCYPSRSGDLGTQVLSIIWSRKPSPGPLLHVSEVELANDSFDGLAIQPRLLVGQGIRKIQLRLGHSFSCASVTAVLKKATPLCLSSFTLNMNSFRTLSWPEADSLELLSTLRGVRTLGLSMMPLTARAISIIATFPALEDLRLGVTEQEVENYTPVGNSFPVITELGICSETIDTCQLLLMKIQSTTLRSLEVARTLYDDWNVGTLFVVLPACNLASRLESLHIDSIMGGPPFEIDARTFECLHSFERLHDLHIYPTSVDLNDNDLLKLAKSLPQLRSLIFEEAYDPDNVPKCTFTGMQHIIHFCPKLERLTICIDARRIPTFATQPDGEYPIGRHLIALDIRASPVSNACNVASYLIMLLPALTEFLCAYTCSEEDEEEEEAASYRAIWLEVEELLNPVIQVTNSKGR